MMMTMLRTMILMLLRLLRPMASLLLAFEREGFCGHHEYHDRLDVGTMLTLLPKVWL